MAFGRTYPDIKYERMEHSVNDTEDDLGYHTKQTVCRENAEFMKQFKVSQRRIELSVIQHSPKVHELSFLEDAKHLYFSAFFEKVKAFHRAWHWTKIAACVPVKVIDFVFSNIFRLNIFMYWKVAGRLPTFLDKYCMYDERLVKLKSDIGELEREKASLRDSMRTLETEKQTALTRLSEVVSVKLRDNNPNIVDLNDQFRPTKLAEMFSEMYDNEWTGAYSILEEPFGEEYSIVILLDIVMEVYGFCEERVAVSWNILTEWFLDMSLMGAQQTSKWLKDSRKARIRNKVKDIEKDYEQRLLEKFKENKLAELLSQNEMKLYITKCVELCLLMVTTDPPVDLSCPGWTPGLKNQGNAKSIVDKEFEKAYFENNEEQDKPDLRHSTRERNIFDKDLYKEYTTRGTYLDYVVWPALFLYREGPLLSKGIAQGRKEQQWEPKNEQWA